MESENASQYDPSLPDPTGNPASTPVGKEIQCPRCGSTHVSRQIMPLVLNIAACAIAAALIPLSDLMILATMASLAVLPIAASTAITDKRRCRDCRRRFELDEPWKGPTAPPRFPITIYLADIALLFFLCVVSPRIARGYAGDAKALRHLCFS